MPLKTANGRKATLALALLHRLLSERAPWIRNLFSSCPAEFARAPRNPATPIPALHARFEGEENFGQHLARIGPEALCWADVVQRMRASVPDARLTVRCNDDSPLNWPDIVQTLSGVPNPMRLEGSNDFIASLMSEVGSLRLQTYLDRHPASGAEHWRKVVPAFLAKFALPKAVEEEFDLPG